MGDRVWLDLNSDGIQQPDEPAASATVSLLTVAGSVVATTTTDASGRYRFTNLRGGRYRLQFTSLPAHRALTAPAAGSDRALDSDPDPATGITPVFTLAQGAQSRAGHRRRCRPDRLRKSDAERWLGGRVLGRGHGLAGQGRRRVLGPSDNGVAGVTVELMDSESHVIATEVTSPTGKYSFDRLPAGNYKIRFSKVPADSFISQDAGDSPAIDSDVDQRGETQSSRLGVRTQSRAAKMPASCRHRTIAACRTQQAAR